MGTIQAWQHIFSNVEKEQSPQGRGGFQTLFYSHAGLTATEVEEMESRLLYFPSTVEPVKRLFFATTTGKGVVSQIVFLPNPDQFGRGGRYLAHSLIFGPEALIRFEADPFRVFRRFSFVTTVAQALKQGNFQTGDIPSVSLELPPQLAGDVEAAGWWPVGGLKQLALLALGADRQARDRNAITLAGSPEQIEQALEAAFLAVPASIRAHCSFDTYFYRCNLVATYFWAIGLPEPPVSAKFVVVEAATRQIQGAVPQQPETAYERWVLADIDRQKLDQIARHRDEAFAIAEWLDGRPYDLDRLEAARSDLIETVFQRNPQAVQAALRRQISQRLPPALVDRSVGQIYQQASQAALYRYLRQGVDLPWLLERLYESYAAQAFRKPPRSELKALGTVLDQSEHQLLRLFLTHWTESHKQLVRELRRLDKETYRQFGQVVLRHKLAKPVELLVAGHGDTFLDLYLTDGSDDLVELIEALLEVKETACLPRLSNKLSILSRKELTRVVKLTEDRADIPNAFQEAVVEARAALPPRRSLKGMLKAILPGRSGKS
jgi:hypothetical protein